MTYKNEALQPEGRKCAEYALMGRPRDWRRRPRRLQLLTTRLPHSYRGARVTANRPRKTKIRKMGQPPHRPPPAGRLSPRT